MPRKPSTGDTKKHGDKLESLIERTAEGQGESGSDEDDPTLLEDDDEDVQNDDGDEDVQNDDGDDQRDV